MNPVHQDWTFEPYTGWNEMNPGAEPGRASRILQVNASHVTDKEGLHDKWDYGINAVVWISLKLCSIHLFLNAMVILGRRKVFIGVWKLFLKSVFVLCKKVLSADFYFCSPEGRVMERIQVQHGLPTGHIQREITYREFLKKVWTACI